MLITLFINLYVDSNSSRQKELELTLRKNISNSIIDNIYILVEQTDIGYWLNTFPESGKLKYIIVEQRPFFNDYFKMFLPDQINIVSNSDIYFDETLKFTKTLTENECFALTRWDINTKNGDLTRLDRIDANEYFIFYGQVQNIEGADFPVGLAGGDNSMCYLLKKNGYKLSNPSKSIRGIHLHDSGIRNYLDKNGEPFIRISPPYHFVEPCCINQI